MRAISAALHRFYGCFPASATVLRAPASCAMLVENLDTKIEAATSSSLRIPGLQLTLFLPELRMLQSRNPASIGLVKDIEGKRPAIDPRYVVLRTRQVCCWLRLGTMQSATATCHLLAFEALRVRIG